MHILPFQPCAGKLAIKQRRPYRRPDVHAVNPVCHANLRAAEFSGRSTTAWTAATSSRSIRSSSSNSRSRLAPPRSAADEDAVVEEPVPRADEILPDSLGGALSDAAESTADALRNTTNRCRVEIIMPEFWDPMSGPIFPDKGDNEKFWKMCKRFVDRLIEESQAKNPVVIFPDMGVAAMCRNWWPEAPFEYAAVYDRRPVTPEHDLVVFAAPDPYSADAVRRIVRQVGEQDDQSGEQRAIVMFNPRLASGDVGIGLNARRLQQEFLNTFMVTYSLQPYGEEASVFRRYPGMWMVFVEDPQFPGRYQLAKEMVARPVGDDLEYIISRYYRQLSGEVGDAAEPTPLEQLASTVRSLSSFMKALTK